jgi:hypothetical protein
MLPYGRLINVVEKNYRCNLLAKTFLSFPSSESLMSSSLQSTAGHAWIISVSRIRSTDNLQDMLNILNELYPRICFKKATGNSILDRGCADNETIR